MTILHKDYGIEVTAGSSGTSAQSAVAAKSEYYTEYYIAESLWSGIVNSYSCPTTLPYAWSDISNDNNVSVSQGHSIKICTVKQLYNYVSSLKSLMAAVKAKSDAGEDFSTEWAAYMTKATSMLQAKVNSGYLGSPIAYLSDDYGTNGYIAAWYSHSYGSVWFYAFTGFASGKKPYQKVS
jgi:hypothetical protein